MSHKSNITQGDRTSRSRGCTTTTAAKKRKQLSKEEGDTDLIVEDDEEIQKWEEKTIEEILLKNGAPADVIADVKAIAAVNNDSPVLVVDWFLTNLLTVLNNPVVQTAPNIPALPPNFVIPAVLNEANLKTAILNCIRGPVPHPQLIGTSGLECTDAQFGNVTAASAVQAHDAWWAYQHANIAGGICPIGQLWVPRARSNKMSRTGIMLPVSAGAIPLWN